MNRCRCSCDCNAFHACRECRTARLARKSLATFESKKVNFPFDSSSLLPFATHRQRRLHCLRFVWPKVDDWQTLTCAFYRHSCEIQLTRHCQNWTDPRGSHDEIVVSRPCQQFENPATTSSRFLVDSCQTARDICIDSRGSLPPSKKGTGDYPSYDYFLTGEGTIILEITTIFNSWQKCHSMIS